MSIIFPNVSNFYQKCPQLLTFPKFPRNVLKCLILTLTLHSSRCWENENDLTVINLNNILNIPHELLEELMEALEENVYVRELSLVNTGLTDKVAYALAKVDFNQ